MANRITGFFNRGAEQAAQVKEIVGRVAVTSMRNLRGARKSLDATVPDYKFWDEFRRGKVPGFELASLLAKPATEIMASWVGTPSEAKITTTEQGDVEHTNELLRHFLRRTRGVLARLMVNLFGLGDQYVVINPDGSLSIPSPDTVKPEYDAVDYRKLIKVTITTKLDKAEVKDEYRLDGRTVRIKNTSSETLSTAFGVVAARETVSVEYENLVGRVPVVHFPNDRGVNETNGRPMYAALYEWFSWYNDLLKKALRGANRLSIPILTWTGLDDVEKTKEDNSLDIGETYQDEDGSIRNREQVALEEDEPVLMLGPGADAKFVSPPTGFTNDIRNMGKWLYLLFMEHLHLPDVVMGFELSSARASAAEQIKTFFAHIQGRRVELEGEGADDLLMVEAHGGLLAVFDIWLRMKALTDRRVMVEPVTLTWPELAEADETMRFNWVKYLDGTGRLTSETVIQQADVVEDVKGELERAEAENTPEPDPWQREEADAETDVAELMAA